MYRRNKSKNILLSLRDRESSSGAEAYHLGLNIISHLVKSDTTYYNCSWHKESNKPITYDFGLLYFNDYSKCCSVYGREGQPDHFRNFKPRSARKKIIDIAAYNTPVCHTFKNCKCVFSKCSCTSRFVLCLTKDNWLCQFNTYTGELLTEVFVRKTGCTFNFKYCDWDKYAERIILTSQLDPPDSHYHPKSDVVVNLAVFTVFPLQFMSVIEIRRSIFGSDCKHANVDGELILVGMGYNSVNIYDFNTLLMEGELKPFKLGDQLCGFGRIGEYPTGLPQNFTISSAPPVLYNIQCFGQSVSFGGYPYQCIFPDPKFHLRFTIQSLFPANGSTPNFIESNVCNDEPNIVFFYPDNSNRIISRELLRLRVYDIHFEEGRIRLKESHTMEFENCLENRTRPEFSRFGRRFSDNSQIISLLSERSILATDYEDELDLYGILGIRIGDPENKGFVKLYDSLTGKEVKTIELEQSLCDIHYYMLHLDRDLIVIIEKNLGILFHVYVYKMTENL